MLNTLTFGPRRITELADIEGLAQPTTTLLVKRLEHRGLVRRERQDYDGRIVMVTLTSVGRGVFEGYRSELATRLRTDLAEVVANVEVETLISATATLSRSIVLLQGRRR